MHSNEVKVGAHNLLNPSVALSHRPSIWHSDRKSVAMAAVQTLERPTIVLPAWPASPSPRVVLSPRNPPTPKKEPRPTPKKELSRPSLTLPAASLCSANDSRVSREERLKRSSRIAPRASRTSLALASEIENQGALSSEEQLACCHLIQEAHALRQAMRKGTQTDQFRYQRALQLAAQAQSLLLKSYRRYITLQAKRLQHSVDVGRKASYEDMFIAGVLGLTQAAHRYGANLRNRDSQDTTPDKPSARFLTFAHFWIRKYMIQALRGFDSSDVYIPQYLTDVKSKVAAAVNQLQIESSGATHSPSVQAVAHRAQVPVSHAAEVIRIMTTSVVPVGDSGDEGDDDGLAATWKMDIQTQEGGQSLVVNGKQDLNEVDNRDSRLKEILSGILNPKEVNVLCLVSGVGHGSNGNQLEKTQVGAILGVSRQAVSQVYDRAVRKVQTACAKDLQLCKELEEMLEGGAALF